MVLAPMVGVTDCAFRRIIARYGKPDVMWTEFVSVDGLLSPGRDKIMHELEKTDAERPIVAQIFGGKPDNFTKIAKFIVELGFDGIDINMGCPSKEIEKFCAGAALIKKPELAQEIILATMDGAGRLPVSVKTRIGYRDNTVDEWLTHLLDVQPAAVTIHARTRDELSRVPARWDVVGRAVELARQLEPDPAKRPLIIGNGDVESRIEAEARATETGCDGVMIGRGIFGNPWLFNREVDRDALPVEEVLEVMLEHTALFIELLGRRKPIELMKKHYKAYVKGFPGAPELRAKLMDSHTYDGMRAIVDEFLGSREAAAVAD
jgi:nifR3 family TIM-barrel protein